MERNDKENNKHISIIHEKDMIQNLKKYYNIDDHFDLLKFIKKKRYKYYPLACNKIHNK